MPQPLGRSLKISRFLFFIFFNIYAFGLWGFRRRRWHPTPVLLPGKSHGRRSLVGCSPWGREESDTTERLHFPFSLSCIGEGNGNPLQCSCLENPRFGGAWWAAVYGVAQSRTRLKRLSSSSSCSLQTLCGGMCNLVHWPGREARPLAGSEAHEPLALREAPASAAFRSRGWCR